MSSLTALIYASMLPDIKELAEKHGYALAIHGSMAKDFDVIAVPWGEDVSSPQVFINDLAKALGGHGEAQADGPEKKPHGRLAWTVPVAAGLALDVSITPRGSRRTSP